MSNKTKDRRINVPYGFYLKSNKITFFNRDYLPLGMERSSLSDDEDYVFLPWNDYLNLFHFNMIPARLRNQYISFSVSETTYNYLKVFYLYNDSHA